jgi:U3 small nucleolar RNA-associated protein 15
MRLLSTSDDSTLRMWDITVGSQITLLEGHHGYVRSASKSPISSDSWLTGGYDHSIRMWDFRHKSCSIKLDHGAPVEDVIILPSGTLAASVGGNSVCLWDLPTSGLIVRSHQNGYDTITCACLFSCNSNLYTNVLITGHLNGYVKVYDINDLKVIHSWKYPSSVLCLSVSPNLQYIVVGMTNGMLCISSYQHNKMWPVSESHRPCNRIKSRLTTTKYSFMSDKKEITSYHKRVITRQHNTHSTIFSRWLKRFRHREALTAALVCQNPEIIEAMIMELVKCGKLVEALSSRSTITLPSIFDFLCKYISDPKYVVLVIQVSNLLLDVIFLKLVERSFNRNKIFLFTKNVLREVQFEEELMVLKGFMSPIISYTEN